MKLTVDIDLDSASNLVLEMLKEDYKLTQRIRWDDDNLLPALKEVIKYYSTPPEYEQWKAENNETD